jgi:hypothetical protein
MWRLVPALLLPVTAGLLATHWVWPEAGGRPARRLLRVSLAVGCGLGLTSSAFFLALVWLGVSRHMAVSADIAMVALFLGLAWSARPPSAERQALHPIPTPAAAAEGAWTLLGVAAVVTLVAAITTLVLLSWIQPHGEWDAWAFWNLRARFLFFGRGEQWRASLDPLAGPHPDYPMLLPGIVARSWLYVGRASLAVPALVGALFTLATAGLAGAAVATLRGTASGLLAAIVILGTPGFTVHGSMQYADVPLSFFFLATLVLLWLHDRGETVGARGLWLAGTTVGLAAWTKNEGLLFAGALLAARFAVVVPRHGWRAYARELVPFGAGLLPVLAMVLYFKLRLAPPVLYMLDQGPEVVRDRLTDLSRYLQIVRFLGGRLVSFGGFIVSVSAILAFYALAAGVRVTPADRRPLATAALTLAIVALGYLAVFQLTAVDLENWLGSGLERNFLQLWPAGVVVYWLAVAPPGGRAVDG